MLMSVCDVHTYTIPSTAVHTLVCIQTFNLCEFKNKKTVHVLMALKWLTQLIKLNSLS